MINVSLYGVVGLESGSRHFESEARTLAELKKASPGSPLRMPII